MNEEIKNRIRTVKSGEVPDGYVSTEYGVFPSHWRLAELREIAQPLTDTVGTRKIETVSISAGIGFVNQAEKFGKELSGKQYEKYIVLHRGDFSYNKGNSNLYPQGCIYRLNDREIAAVPNVFESFRIVNGDPDYYEQLFLSGFLNHQLFRKINHGVRDDGLLNLTDTDFYSCVLPVPPIEEQHRIAEILSACDRMLALHQETLSEAKEMKKSFLNKMFPKDGACYPELRFVGFTGAWEQRKVSDVAPLQRGFDLPASQMKDGPYPVVMSNGVGGYHSEYKIKGPGVITGRSGTIGKLHYIEGNYWPHNTSLWVTDFKGNYPRFIFHMYQRLDLSQYGSGSGVPTLNRNDVHDAKVYIPVIEEQRGISSFLDNLDALITLHQREVELQQNKKKALMQLLLTGFVHIS